MEICNCMSGYIGRRQLWMGADELGVGTMANATSKQVALLPVFPVSLEEELTVLDKLLSVTCADLVACSHPPRSGESGTKRSTLARSENTPLVSSAY
jgi:hypothetical protein